MEGDQAPPLSSKSVEAESAGRSRSQSLLSFSLGAGGWGPESGSWPLSGSPIMTWHQHLDCGLLLLLSKAVLKGDGFLIEIQSIGAEARRAQHEHTSGEIALGRGGGVGEGSGATGPAQALLWSL